MKKIIIIALVLLSVSCNTYKTARKSHEFKVTEKTETKRDSVSKISVNKPIEDYLSIQVTKSNTDDAIRDSVINKKVDEILSRMNTTKRSGDNSYKLYYNIEKRLLELQAKIGETKSIQIETKKAETSEKTFEEKTDEYINKKIKSIPFWVYILVAFWFLPQIIERIQLLINPFKMLLKRFKK